MTTGGLCIATELGLGLSTVLYSDPVFQWTFLPLTGANEATEQLLVSVLEEVLSRLN